MVRFEKIPFLAEGGYINAYPSLSFLPTEVEDKTTLFQAEIARRITHSFMFVLSLDKKEILLAEHAMRGFCLPGGTREQGETSRGCAIRELREETGLYGFFEHNLKRVGFSEVVNPNDKTGKFPSPSYMTYYLAEMKPWTVFGEATAPLTEIVGKGFVSLDKAQALLKPWELYLFQQVLDLMK